MQPARFLTDDRQEAHQQSLCSQGMAQSECRIGNLIAIEGSAMEVSPPELRYTPQTAACSQQQTLCSIERRFAQCPIEHTASQGD